GTQQRRGGEKAVAVADGGGDRRRQVVVELAQQPLTTDHLGDLAAEGREHVAELGGDDPATDDHDPAGQVVDTHDGVGGVIVHVGQARDVRDHRGRSGGEHESVTGDGRGGAVVQRDLE